MLNSGSGGKRSKRVDGGKVLTGARESAVLEKRLWSRGPGENGACLRFRVILKGERPVQLRAPEQRSSEAP